MNDIVLKVWVVWLILSIFWAFTGWLLYKLHKERDESALLIAKLTVTMLKQYEKIADLKKELTEAQNGKAK